MPTGFASSGSNKPFRQRRSTQLEAQDTRTTFRAPGLTTLTAAVVFVTAMAVRLLHIWQMRDTLFFSVLMGDSRGYDAWAQQIAAGEWAGRDVFYQAPLYPYFLGVVYTVFGHDLLTVRLLQAGLGAAGCVALACAAARLVSPRAGVVAGPRTTVPQRLRPSQGSVNKETTGLANPAICLMEKGFAARP